jgi:hypothetical protein
VLGSFLVLLQCRPFSVFNEKRLETCHPYLKNTTHYYLVRKGGSQASRYKTFPGSIERNLHSVLFHCMQQAETPWFDDPATGFSAVTQLAGILENAMNPTCASNVISLLCNTFFKECVRVQDASSRWGLWLPSLLCRGACNKHKEIWAQCLRDLELDPAAKSNFDAQMMSLVRHTMCLWFVYTFETGK